MYDYVKHKAKCWRCGAKITSWQSKSSDEPSMIEINIEQVDNFYSPCNKCKAWNEYDVVNGEIILNKKESEYFTDD